MALGRGTASSRRAHATDGTAQVHADAGRDGRSIRVLIADDHQLVGECLALFLSERGDLEVVGVAHGGVQAVELSRTLKPDVVLLDIRMPDMDGFQVLVAIQSASPMTKVIMLTSYSNANYLARAVQMGAAGFLSKELDPAHIPYAVHSVLHGDATVDQRVLQAVLKSCDDETQVAPPSEGHASLTEQELRVLKLMAEGLDNPGIARNLFVSKNTVKTHVQSIYSKLGVTDRTQAALWALRQGLVH